MNRRQWQMVGVVVALLTVGLFLVMTRDRDATGVYRGHYTLGFETRAFRACGERDSWWVETFNPAHFPALTHAQTAALAAPADEAVMIYVEWRGTRSARRGTATTKADLGYGHLGMYPRLFTVDQLITARPPRPDDCR